ncbi:MAG: hypothetical protein NWE89_01795 [Candidatus Bathyarchaeota archaeon]|nr:hypothetical protein [Candidatus Bathyarchaeota archaeon]
MWRLIDFGAIEKLEEHLEGVSLTKEALTEAIASGFEKTGLMVFGATQEDFVEAILKAKIETG